MSYEYPLVASVIAQMEDDEIDRAIGALMARQRECLLSCDIDGAFDTTRDLELCLATRTQPSVG